MNHRDQQLADLLTELKAHDQETRASSVVDRIVMARWDARASKVAKPCLQDVERVPVARRQRRGILRTGATTAATMAAAITLFVWFGRPGPRVVETPGGNPPPPKSAATPSRGEADAAQMMDPSRETMTTSRKPRGRRTVARPVDTEQRIAFEELTPLDVEGMGGVRMMRVRLTSGAASSLGLMAHASVAADGYVQADVLVGEDGMARAIRLVHQP